MCHPKKQVPFKLCICLFPHRVFLYWTQEQALAICHRLTHGCFHLSAAYFCAAQLHADGHSISSHIIMTSEASISDDLYVTVDRWDTISEMFQWHQLQACQPHSASSSEPCPTRWGVLHYELMLYSQIIFKRGIKFESRVQSFQRKQTCQDPLLKNMC